MVPSLSSKLEQLNEALTSEHKKESTIMIQETRYVGLDIGKFEIYAFDASRNTEVMIANTAEGERQTTQSGLDCGCKKTTHHCQYTHRKRYGLGAKLNTVATSCCRKERWW